MVKYIFLGAMLLAAIGYWIILFNIFGKKK